MLTLDLLLRIIAASLEALVLILKDATPADRAALLQRHNERLEFLFGWVRKLKGDDPTLDGRG